MSEGQTADGAALRPVERADLLAVVRIEERTFDSPWHLGSFERFLGAPAFLVLEDPRGEELGEGLSGFVVGDVIDRRNRRFGHLKDLAVKPSRQRGGRGRRLLEGALAQFAAHGADQARLEVRPSNRPARGLYDAAGFEVIGRRERYYQDGEDALVMARRLSGSRSTKVSSLDR
ncbi:MAG: GNAT family N-acetyltransferase [Halodesulfurarchaeum sp.]